jgi:predicted GNAT family N-acyltransferase
MFQPGRDAGTFTVRLIAESDREGFDRFVASLSAEEKRFLKEDLDPSHADGHLLPLTAGPRRLVAVEEDGEIAGVSGAFPGTGWSSHVAELRVVVSNARRRQGMGRALARAALVEALRLGCSHTYVEVVSEQEALVEMFQDMGFEPEALLEDFVRDAAGDYHDLMLLTHRADDAWGRSRLMGLQESIS